MVVGLSQCTVKKRELTEPKPRQDGSDDGWNGRELEQHCVFHFSWDSINPLCLC